MRYRIALCGFSAFESRAMQFSFQHPDGSAESDYEVVDDLADADFAVVDGDVRTAVERVRDAGMLVKAVFIGDRAPPGAAWRLPRPIDTSRILRTLGEIIGGQTAPAAFRDMPIERVFPTLDDVVALPPPRGPVLPDLVVDITAPSAEAVRPTAQGAAGGPADGDAASAGSARRALHSLAKAAARAAARRARLASAQAAGASIEPLCDVLVLDADRPASLRLCELLARFGFLPVAVHGIAEAEAELARRPYAAVFLDIALDEVGGALLQRIRALPPADPHPPPAVLMVTAGMGPSERVRAALAGVGTPLVKPLGRGDVARALESAGVALPADARRL